MGRTSLTRHALAGILVIVSVAIIWASSPSPAQAAPIISSVSSTQSTTSYHGVPHWLLAWRIMHRRHNASHYSCLAEIVRHESRWRVHAVNPGSGAYGIPQALPGSKMGPGWRWSARVQIMWMLRYLHLQYGGVCPGWAFWQGHGWY